jgi:hypothetical protein
MTREATLPLESFIQAVQAQLDKAQTAMAVKARNLNLPMTFAIKDISMDLRAHVEFARGEIRIRPAGSEESDASVFHLVFTGITRPMIEENAVAFTEDPDDLPIEELEDEFTDEERRQLEWAGIRTVRKLREVEREGASGVVGRVTNLPVSRLRQALQRAASPVVDQVTPVDRPSDDSAELRRILRVRGRNLAADGAPPKVTIDGQPTSILRSRPDELLVVPDRSQWSGELRVETSADLGATMAFDLGAFAPAEMPPPPDGGNGYGVAEDSV